jgi:uncharacterized membrane protein YkgB
MSRTFVTKFSGGAPASRPIDLSRHISDVARLLPLGETLVRCALIVIFLWFGAMKFTDYEASGTARWIIDSPLVGWWHAAFGIKGTSVILGVIEMTTGALFAARLWSPLLSAIGAAIASVALLITISFLFSAPGVAEPLAGGFPAISAELGQFLLKDVALLAISIYCFGDSLAKMHKERAIAKANANKPELSGSPAR